MATEIFEISRDDLVDILSNRYRTPSTCINIVGTVEKVEVTVYTPDWEIEYAKRFREEKENKKHESSVF